MDFTNFNNLISFGCSHTWGACMPDIFDPKDKHGQQRHEGKIYPSKHAWGNIVASIFGLHHDNQSMAGASNRYILYKILNYDYNNDVVCVLWSHTHRHTVFKSEKRFENWGPFSVDTSKSARMWFQHCYQSYDSILDTAQCIHHAMLYLNSKNIPNYHILQTKEGKDLFKGFSKQPIKYILESKIQNVFFDEYRRIPPLALDNKHAGEKAHRKFGKAVARSILNNKQIKIGELL